MIVSGAVAERIRFVSYGIFSLLLTAIAYPIIGHWIWSPITSQLIGVAAVGTFIVAFSVLAWFSIKLVFGLRVTLKNLN